MIKLRFIGKDGSMGLKHGKLYPVRIYSSECYIWIDWGHNKCPYSSIKLLSENWC